MRILSLGGFFGNGIELKLKVTRDWKREDINQKLETGTGSIQIDIPDLYTEDSDTSQAGDG